MYTLYFGSPLWSSADILLSHNARPKSAAPMSRWRQMDSRRNYQSQPPLDDGSKNNGRSWAAGFDLERTDGTVKLGRVHLDM
jgi:hypothetical protein